MKYREFPIGNSTTVTLLFPRGEVGKARVDRSRFIGQVVKDRTAQTGRIAGLLGAPVDINNTFQLDPDLSDSNKLFLASYTLYSVQ